MRGYCQCTTLPTQLFISSDTTVHFGRLRCSIINDAGVQLKRHIRYSSYAYQLPIISLHTAKPGYAKQIDDIRPPYFTRTPELDLKLLEGWMTLEQMETQRWSPLHTPFTGVERPYGGPPNDGSNMPEIRKHYTKRFIENIPIIAADRIRIFLETLATTSLDSQLHPKINDYYAPEEYIESQFHFSENGVFSPHYNPILPNLHKFLYVVYQKTTLRDGLKGTDYWIWNTLIPLIFLLIVFCCSRWLPASAYCTIPILLITLATALTLPADHWRYFYFTYLCGWFTPIFVLTEIATKKNTG